MRGNRQPIILVLIVGFGLLAMGVCVSTRAAAQGGPGAGASALTFEPATLTLSQGGAASAKVTVILKSGKTGGTTLRADLPGGLAITFDPPTGEPPFTSTMTLKAGPNTTPGTYAVRVQAIGGAPSSVFSFPVAVEKTSGY